MTKKKNMAIAAPFLSESGEVETHLLGEIKSSQEEGRVGEGLDALEQTFAKLKPFDREKLISQALAFARSRAPERELTDKTLSRTEISARFPKGR